MAKGFLLRYHGGLSADFLESGEFAIGGRGRRKSSLNFQPLKAHPQPIPLEWDEASKDRQKEESTVNVEN